MTRYEGQTIQAAAIWHDGMTYSMARPNRHHDIGHKLIALGLEDVSLRGEQGFVTSRGVFVRREPAMRIAREAGQLKVDPINANRLHTEDLW